MASRTPPPDDDLTDALNGTGPFKWLYEAPHLMEPKTCKMQPSCGVGHIPPLHVLCGMSIEVRREMREAEGWAELERIAKGEL